MYSTDICEVSTCNYNGFLCLKYMSIVFFCYHSLLWLVLCILVNVDQDQKNKLLLVNITYLDKKAALIYIV